MCKIAKLKTYAFAFILMVFMSIGGAAQDVPIGIKLRISTIKGATFEGKWKVNYPDSIGLAITSRQVLFIAKADIEEAYSCRSHTASGLFIGAFIGSAGSLFFGQISKGKSTESEEYDLSRAVIAGLAGGLVGAFIGSIVHSCDEVFEFGIKGTEIHPDLYAQDSGAIVLLRIRL
jgi:hypothetical protein